MRVQPFPAASALVAVMVACTSAPPNPPPEPEPFDTNGDWVLESGSQDGAPLPFLADYPITLTVNGPEVGGTSACNSYFGRLVMADGGVRIGEMGSTAMACGGPDSAVMRSEAAYQRALGQVRALRGEGHRLALRGPAVELVFTRPPPVPIDAIVDTDWLLETVIDGEIVRAAIGEPATLRVDRTGTFRGTTGCRTFTGTWILAAGHMVATETTMNGECAGGLGGQDGVVAEAVSGSVPWIDGDRLTLTKPGGLALIYRRAGP